MPLQPFCLLPELHRGIIQLSERMLRIFLAEFPTLKEHLLNPVKIEHSHECTGMPSVCNISVFKHLKR